MEYSALSTDLEHFARTWERVQIRLVLPNVSHMTGHAHIEAEEDNRERKYKGLEEGADLDTDRAVHDPLDQHAHGSQDPPIANDSGEGAQQAFIPTAGGILPRRPEGSAQSRPARIDRSKPDLSGKGELNNWAKEAKNRPGYGESDFHRPRNAEDRLRKGVPYSSWFRLSRSKKRI